MVTGTVRCICASDDSSTISPASSKPKMAVEIRNGRYEQSHRPHPRRVVDAVVARRVDHAEPPPCFVLINWLMTRFISQLIFELFIRLSASGKRCRTTVKIVAIHESHAASEHQIS